MKRRKKNFGERMKALRKRKGKKNPPRRAKARRRSASSSSRPVIAVARANPPRHKKRRHHRRRNPARGSKLMNALSLSGVIDQVKTGVVDATYILVGRGGVRFVASKTNFAGGSVMDAIVESGAAIALGLAASLLLGPDAGRGITGGGLSSVLEDVVAGFNIPTISDLFKGTPTNVNTSLAFGTGDLPAGQQITRIATAGPMRGYGDRLRMGAYAGGSNVVQDSVPAMMYS